MSKSTYVETRAAFAELCCKNVSRLRVSERRDAAPKEFDDLCADPRVRFVAIKGTTLIIGTHALVMTEQKAPYTRYLLGERILQINAATRLVRVEAVTHPARHMSHVYVHPHIHPDMGPPLDNN